MAADAYLGMVDVLKEESKEGTRIDIIEDASRNFYSGERLEEFFLTKSTEKLRSSGGARMPDTLAFFMV